MKKLKIFAIADIHSPDNFSMPELDPKQFDLLITLGDIASETMDYIQFMGRFVESIGVLGNHDPKQILGLNDIHCKVVEIGGIKFGGFGGSLKYKDDPNHYTEAQVAKKMKKMPAVDVFISHAPPYCTSEKEDRLHQGFKAFDDYIERHQPKYWLHGHLSKKYSCNVGKTAVFGIAEKQPLTLEL